MAEFLHYLPQAMTFTNMITLALGVIGGLLLGATPGLSPTMAVALLVPFTFHMEATTGLILLGAVYTATVAGGAISAILINIPGAPANIATMMDGYPISIPKNGCTPGISATWTKTTSFSSPGVSRNL